MEFLDFGLSFKYEMKMKLFNVKYFPKTNSELLLWSVAPELTPNFQLERPLVVKNVKTHYTEIVFIV